MNKFPVKFLNERYEKDEKYFKIYDHYRPDYYKNAITRKFYSKYEQPDLDTADPEIVAKIVLVKDKGPQSRCPWPETTNQEYGWFFTPLLEMDRKDKRFYHPKNSCDVTKFEIFAKKHK